MSLHVFALSPMASGALQPAGMVHEGSQEPKTVARGHRLTIHQGPSLEQIPRQNPGRFDADLSRSDACQVQEEIT